MNEVIDQIKQAADIIGSTFGPAGQNVLFKSRENLPAAMIRDGVKTARRLAACEPLNTGFQLLVDACMSTVRKTGDGTTTTAILVKALLESWSEVDLDKYMVTRLVFQLTGAKKLSSLLISFGHSGLTHTYNPIRLSERKLESKSKTDM